MIINTTSEGRILILEVMFDQILKFWSECYERGKFLGRFSIWLMPFLAGRFENHFFFLNTIIVQKSCRSQILKLLSIRWFQMEISTKPKSNVTKWVYCQPLSLLKTLPIHSNQLDASIFWDYYKHKLVKNSNWLSTLWFHQRQALKELERNQLSVLLARSKALRSLGKLKASLQDAQKALAIEADSEDVST